MRENDAFGNLVRRGLEVGNQREEIYRQPQATLYASTQTHLSFLQCRTPQNC